MNITKIQKKIGKIIPLTPVCVIDNPRVEVYMGYAKAF